MSTRYTFSNRERDQFIAELTAKLATLGYPLTQKELINLSNQNFFTIVVFLCKGNRNWNEKDNLENSSKIISALDWCPKSDLQKLFKAPTLPSNVKKSLKLIDFLCQSHLDTFEPISESDLQKKFGDQEKTDLNHEFLELNKKELFSRLRAHRDSIIKRPSTSDQLVENDEEDRQFLKDRKYELLLGDPNSEFYLTDEERQIFLKFSKPAIESEIAKLETNSKRLQADHENVTAFENEISALKNKLDALKSLESTKSSNLENIDEQINLIKLKTEIQKRLKLKNEEFFRLSANCISMTQDLQKILDENMPSTLVLPPQTLIHSSGVFDDVQKILNSQNQDQLEANKIISQDIQSRKNTLDVKIRQRKQEKEDEDKEQMQSKQNHKSGYSVSKKYA